LRGKSSGFFFLFLLALDVLVTKSLFFYVEGARPEEWGFSGENRTVPRGGELVSCDRQITGSQWSLSLKK
jgi:hypothetical protein